MLYEPKVRVVEATSERVLVAMPRPVDRALHIAKYMPRHQRPTPTLRLPVPRPAHARGALAAALGAIPPPYCFSEVLVPEVHPGIGPSQPWREPEGSALLLPTATAWDLSFDRNMATALLLDPHELPIPASGVQLQLAARTVLERTPRETLLRVALHWAFACDVFHRPWSAHRQTLLKHLLSVPAENSERIRDARDRLVVPQVVRLVAIAAIVGLPAGPLHGAFEYQNAPLLLRTLVDGYFPSLAEASTPTPAEVRTALWLISFESHFEDVADEAVPLLMAQTFGRQSVGEAHDDLARWLTWVEMSDDHPHGTWTPTTAPSELRNALRPTSDLDLRPVAYLVWQILIFMMVSQDVANQLWTIPALAEFAPGIQAPDLSAAWQFLSTSLVRQAHELDDQHGRAAARDATGGPDADAISHRKAIEQWLIDRPFIQFDDGVIVPIGQPETVHGVIGALEAFMEHKASGRTGRQHIANILGGCFQAYVTGLVHTVNNSHRVFDHAVIDSVAASPGKRADLVIADASGWYVVIEATKRSLRGDIRYGNEEALARWADDHITKLQQAQATERRLTKVAAAGDWPAPTETACLVVCDLPLPQTLGLNEMFQRRTGMRRPPFICSISEFELLAKFGARGFSLPSLVLAWQRGHHGIPLGHFLSRWPLR